MNKKSLVKKTVFVLVVGIEILAIALLYSNYSNTDYIGGFLLNPLGAISSNQDPYWNLTFLSSWFNEADESKEFFSYLFTHSNYSELVWELKPNYTSTFNNLLDNDSLEVIRVHINSFGYRGREIHYDAKDNETRVLVVGDSHAFGWGLEDDETFPVLLETLLNEKYEEKNWEIINLAVPGYDLNQKLSMLKIRGLKYDPDIVILQYDADDIFPALLKIYLDYKSGNINNAHDLEVFQNKARNTFLMKNNITEIEKMQIIEPINRLKELEKNNNISQIIFLDYHSIREEFLKEKCENFEWPYSNIYKILDNPHIFRISEYEQHLNSTAQKMVAESLLSLIDADSA